MISYKRLSSYEKLLNEIKRFGLDQLKLVIKKKSESPRTINDLKFNEYVGVLVEDKRKERVILIEENINLDLKVDEVYTCTLSNVYLVDVEEVDVLNLVQTRCDNKITKERIYSSVNYSWYFYLLLIVGFVSIISVTEYYVNLPSDSEVMRIWVDRPSSLTTSDKELIHQKAEELGYKKSLIYEYYNEDVNNYSTAFSTVGLFETDIFLLLKDDNDEKLDSIEAHQDGLYMDLSLLGIEGVEYYSYNGVNIGIKYKEYYILARSKNTKTNEQLKEMIEYIISLN